MTPRPPRFLCAFVFVALAVGLCPARADDADAVKEKLFQAKKAYDGETQKFRAAVAELLDKREEDARKAGNKKLVDQVKGEREKFEKGGELPASVPPAPSRRSGPRGPTSTMRTPRPSRTTSDSRRTLRPRRPRRSR